MSYARISAFEYFCLLKTTFAGFGDYVAFLLGSRNVFLLGLSWDGDIYYFLGRKCSTFGMFIVPLISFKFLSSLNFDLLFCLTFIWLSWCSIGFKLVLLGWKYGLRSSSSGSGRVSSSFLFSERVELNILFALTSNKFFLLFKSALLLSGSP